MSTTSNLLEYIKALIKEKGPITFENYMELALYHPQWGYYMKSPGLGLQGDFYTSPHVNPVFGRMLAKQLYEMWCVAGRPIRWQLVELGPGQGLLFKDIAITIKEKYSDFYDAITYWAVEISDFLIKKQKELLLKYGLENKKIKLVKNLSEIPVNQLEGCFFSNELIDAFPVHLVRQTDTGLKELYVVVKNNQLSLEPGKLSTEELQQYFQLQGVSLENGQTAEVNLKALIWLNNVAKKITRGFILTIDYGQTAEKLYSPERFNGTLRCFYRHQLNEFPLERPGEQDITSTVNFTAMEKWGEKSGLKSLGIISQSQFLINLGILEEIKTSEEFVYDPVKTKLTMAVKQLILPEGMGKTFKVLIQYRGFNKIPNLSSVSSGKGI